VAAYGDGDLCQGAHAGQTDSGLRQLFRRACLVNRDCVVVVAREHLLRGVQKVEICRQFEYELMFGNCDKAPVDRPSELPHVRRDFDDKTIDLGKWE
jgi:hypothetical protein